MTVKIGWCYQNILKWSYEQTLTWAKSVKIETLELTGGPGSANFNVEKILAGQKAAFLEPIQKAGLEIATTSYCTNFLHPNEKQRKERLAHLRKLIEAAQVMDVPIVTCFVGACGGDIFANIKSFEENFIPVLEHARDHGIKIAIENCPAGDENIGSHPYLWEKLIMESAKEFDNLGLEFDPSHLVWVQVDYYQALEDWLAKGKVFCCHAKDTKFKGTDFKGWWTYKLPGLGVIDWKRFFKILNAGDFNGAVQLEHEDSEYSNKKRAEGVQLAIKNLYDAANSI
jgi:sugar phosphate isomerase/epimerase